jgi:hypothetical protein
MKKKIFITENQYKRIFLNESDPPKYTVKQIGYTPAWNKHVLLYTHPAYSDYLDVPKMYAWKKNSDGTWSNAYSDTQTTLLSNQGKKTTVSVDDKDIAQKRIDVENEKFFKENIKSKKDSDAFRMWVNDPEFPERIKDVNKVLKSNGLTGTLDMNSNAPYDNNYMKIAFNKLGRFYVMDKYMDEKNKKEGYDENVSPNVSQSGIYKDYLETLKSWDSSKKTFGWTNPKTISSEKIQQILEGKVAASTCINPSYILRSMEELEVKMFQSISEYNPSIDPQSIMGRLGFDTEMQDIYPKVKSKNEEQKEYNILNKLYKENPALAKTLSGFQEDIPTVEKEILQKAGPKFKEYLEDYNTYKIVLDQVVLHNIIIRNNTSEKLSNACSNPVYNVKTYSVPVSAPGSGGGGAKVNETFTWKQACVNNGGIFMYPAQSEEEEDGIKRKGFIGGKAICCCVNPKGNASVTVKGVDGNYQATINIEEWCGKSTGSILSGWDKFDQWAQDCAEDWHCIADIASIVVMAIGPYGILISGIIDAISAAGYVIEGEEGWKLNAGLTMLGAFGGLAEAGKLLKYGSKFTGRLEDLTKALKMVDGDPIKSRQILRDFAKTLSPEEAKQFKNFGKVANSKEVINKFGKGGSFTNEYNKLDKMQKGVFAEMLKKETPTNLEKLYTKSNKNLGKMVNAYNKGIKQVIIQGSLFAGMYVYSEELGKALKALYDNTGFDPLGVFTSNGEIDSSQLSPDFSNIISNKEKIDSLASNLSKSGFINLDKFKEETDLLTNFYLNIQQIIKLPNKSLELAALSLKKEVAFQINGKRYKHNDIKEVIDLVNPLLEGIINKTYTEQEGINLINDKISVLKTMTKPDIKPIVKTAVLITGDTKLTDEQIDEFQNMLMSGEDNQIPEKIDEGMKKLNEEIKRIKSLFTNERLYGNLVNEVCDNEGEAINFLKDKGYIVRQSNEGDLCLGPNTQIGKVYDKYRSDSKLSFQSGTSPDGCYLGIYRKDKSSRENHFFLINLFEQGLNEKNRFNMYYMLNDNDACEKEITVGSSTFKLIITKDGYDSATQEFGMGLRLIKIEGFWNESSGTINLTGGLIVKLLDKDKKAIKTNIKLGALNVDLSSVLSLNSENGGAAEILKNSSGDCTTIIDFVDQRLGSSLSGTLDLDNFINNQIKV